MVEVEEKCSILTSYFHWGLPMKIKLFFVSQYVEKEDEPTMCSVLDLR